MEKRSKTFKDISGIRFGRWEVLPEFKVERDTKGKLRTYWKCKCTCGTERFLRADIVKSGSSLSCGCLGLEKVSLPYQVAAINSLFKRYAYNANFRKIKFDLTLDEFKSITSQNCHYCGDSPSQIAKGRYGGKRGGNGDYIYNGIDRVDSNKGYTADNTVPCCKKCNYAKREMSTEEFRSWIKKVSDHWVH